MDPIAIAKMTAAALQLASTFIEMYPAIRSALTTTDRAALDAEFNRIQARSNDVADQLRATPPDPT